MFVLVATEGDGRKGKEDKPEPEANFALSGKLAAESNTVKGVVLLHQEPPEARKPAQMWRLYGFKNGRLLLLTGLCFVSNAVCTVLAGECVAASCAAGGLLEDCKTATATCCLDA